MEYHKVVRYVCDNCGLEVISVKTHDLWHADNDERRELDQQEAEQKAQARSMGRFPQTSQLRSDGEWPV